MPWRLIIMIVVFAVFLVFITFNLDNKCDINFFGAVIPNVPVFFTIFISFVLGLLFSIPLFFMILKKRKSKLQNEMQSQVQTAEEPVQPAVVEPDENIKKDAAEAKKRFFSKRRDKK